MDQYKDENRLHLQIPALLYFPVGHPKSESDVIRVQSHYGLFINTTDLDISFLQGQKKNP